MIPADSVLVNDKKKKLSAAVFLILAVVLTQSPAARAVTIGDPFPLFTKPNTLSSQECAFLGIECDQDFSLSDLKQEVMVIEFLNVYCHTCREQVKVFNDLLVAIEQDPEISGKVCVLGIAVGNSPEEIMDFKETFGATYPIVSDQDKKVFNMTGNTRGTPHTYILRNEERLFIVDYHAGGASSMDRYLTAVKYSLRGNLSGTAPGNRAPQYSFSCGGKTLTEKDLSGKMVVLYFPAEKRYALSEDTRNAEKQLDILKVFNRDFPELTTIVFPYPGMRLPKELGSEKLLIADPGSFAAQSEFRSPDRPSVYFINEFGRVGYADESITLFNVSSILKGTEYRPTLGIGDDEIVAIIEAQITRSGHEVISTERLVLDSGEVVYATALAPRRDGKYLFSKLESRVTMCDVCHDSHFIYIIDQEGVLRDFISVKLTKYQNVAWAEADVRKLRTAIDGKSIFNRFPFNPKVDAVATATMSSSLIYESLNEAKKTFAAFKEHKFRYGFWQDLCFKHICSMQKALQREAASEETGMSERFDRLKKPNCPLNGEYVLLDNNILCSVHGFNTRGCKGPENITAEDILNGDQLKAAAEQGKALLLAFGSVYCKACVELLPALSKLHQDSKNSGVMVVAVDIDRQPDDALIEKFICSHNIRFPFVVDTGAVARKYKISMVPTLVLIDSNGKVFKNIRGHKSYRALCKEIKKLR